MKKAVNSEVANVATYFRSGIFPLQLKAAIPGQGCTSQTHENISAPLTQNDGFFLDNQQHQNLAGESPKANDGILLSVLLKSDHYYHCNKQLQNCFVPRPERLKEFI